LEIKAVRLEITHCQSVVSKETLDDRC